MILELVLLTLWILSMWGAYQIGWKRSAKRHRDLFDRTRALVNEAETTAATVTGLMNTIEGERDEFKVQADVMLERIELSILAAQTIQDYLQKENK